MFLIQVCIQTCIPIPYITNQELLFHLFLPLMFFVFVYFLASLTLLVSVRNIEINWEIKSKELLLSPLFFYYCSFTIMVNWNILCGDQYTVVDISRTVQYPSTLRHHHRVLCPSSLWWVTLGPEGLIFISSILEGPFNFTVANQLTWSWSWSTTVTKKKCGSLHAASKSILKWKDMV